MFKTKVWYFHTKTFPDSKVHWGKHGARLGPTGPRLSYVGPMSFAIWIHGVKVMRFHLEMFKSKAFRQFVVLQPNRYYQCSLVSRDRALLRLLSNSEE